MASTLALLTCQDIAGFPPQNFALSEYERKAWGRGYLKLSARKGKQRFGQMVSSEELESISKGFVPKNTKKNTKWALSTFKQWIASRNERSAGNETIDVDILSKPVDQECTQLAVLCAFL